jgi:hypothetical protein
MSYVGVPPFGQTVRTVTEVTAQQDQVTFYPTGGYLPGYIDIELDGSDLGSQDFTATDGLSVVLAQKCGAGDLFRSKAYWPVAMVDTMRRAEINGIVGAGGWAMRNRLINGDMRIDQRNAGASVANANTNKYTVDRFNTSGLSGSTLTFQQVADAPAGFKYSVQGAVTAATTANDGGGFEQRVEASNMLDLQWGTANAQPATLSFWVKSSLTGTFNAAIIFSGSASTYYYVATYSISQANTWTQVVLNIPGAPAAAGAFTGADNAMYAYVRPFVFGSSGSTVYAPAANAWSSTAAIKTSGAVNWASAAGATFNITGVQLEKGSYATPFDFRPIGTELALCQRYYQNIIADASPNPAYYGMGAAYTSGATLYTNLMLPVQMRALPTVNFTVSSKVNLNTPAAYARGSGRIEIQSSSPGGGDTYLYASVFNASAEL